MAQTFEERKKKQQLLVFVFLGIVVLVGVVAYQSFFNDDSEIIVVPDLSFIGEESAPSQIVAKPVVGPKDIDKLLKRLKKFKFHTPIPIPLNPSIENPSPFGS